MTATTTADGSAFGVYVHVPFCSARCDYCAFATWTDRAHLIDSYVDAVCADITRVLSSGEHRLATSVFFGGGTPSLLPGPALVRILRCIPMAGDAEVTVECNPETVSRELFDHYVAGGVNRLSFGVQSMVPTVLAALGRKHDPMAVVQGMADARAAGIDRINLDLIYGGAGETIDQWRTTLDSVVDLGPDHVSAYALTVEAGTPLAADPARHPDDDDQADKYLLAEAVLAGSGFHNYEISNWAMPGQECAHNLLYWAQGDYLGFGCAAHSHLAGRRWWNVRTPDRYISCVAADESVEAASETLGEETRRIEGLQLALRTDRGVPAGTLASEDREQLDHLIVDDGERVRLTVEGRLMANEVAVRLR
jgi:oxygen-independent coproporphyrinogen-3 oxidase